ncbi:short chain dehydrogenase, partial [Mesorhizobium sp. M2D.F.Ca.ET.140.01.1.1]
DIEGAYRLLPEVELSAAQRVVESKFYGPLLLAKHGAPKLSATGSLTFVSGIAAYRPAARGSVVAAVNAALEGLVR